MIINNLFKTIGYYRELLSLNSSIFDFIDNTRKVNICK